MLSTSLKRFMLAATVAAATVASLPAQAAYGGLVIFGDSLSDSGNNYLAQSFQTTPNSDITSNGFIPTYTYTPAAPYPFGVYSNGPVWATYFAGALGLSALPALLPNGTNFAFGGARTSGGEPPPSLTSQVGIFLNATQGVAPSSFLYVVAGGGNNARDAIGAILGGADPYATTGATAYQYASDVGTMVDSLQAAGAKNIVVWNTPNPGVAPALNGNAQASVIGAGVAATMNGALAQRLKNEPGVTTFDTFGLLTKITSDPGAYGLSNAKDACLLGECDTSKYLFWDGTHPTARGHELLAQAVYAQVVPEPETYLLFAVGLAALAWRSRKRAR